MAQCFKLDHLENEGIIEKVEWNWAAPIVPVPIKKIKKMDKSGSAVDYKVIITTLLEVDQ